MKKYIDAEKLKAEITRIYNEHPVYISERYEDGVDDGYHGCCDEIVAVIDSLQQEQPELPDNLDKAARDYGFSCYKRVCFHPEHIWPSTTEEAFKAGAEWMAERAKKQEVDLDEFTEKIKNFQSRYKHPEVVSIKGAMAFMARMFYQYPNVARQWYEQLPKVTMD